MSAAVPQRLSKMETFLRWEHHRPAHSPDQMKADLEKLRQAIEGFRKQIERLERQAKAWHRPC